ncbi:unnamed protein product [Adineta steineri]|uniref:Riboflavin transporter n=1 Tax=Adineta steineri TaxID=433720 RepID=A0A814MG37_9BILA|nr:unnamed protein product [Adineta steineri]CAF3919051.1 unnamed protein product [Adineta steineri]
MEDNKTQVVIITEEKKSQSKSKKIFGYVLFILFGIGTWLNLNGIWIELPLLIPELSEGWGLSPQLGMASNIANVGPLIIAVIRHLIGGESSAYEVPSICVIFLVGITVPIILSFTWFKQVFFLGTTRSLYLLVLGFFLALVNCTSSVTYLPFVNRFHKKWLNIYFAGESLSSLIPAILGLLQGVGQEAKCIPSPTNQSIMIEQHFPARFSVQIYLICLSIIMCISFIAFLLLWRTQPQEKNQKKSQAEQIIAGENAQDSLLTVNNNDVIVKSPNDNNEEKFSMETIIYLLIILWTSILLIGCIPSINSYSLNPYGASTFHYVLILCQCCYPLVSLISTLRPQLFQVSKIGIILSTISGTLAFSYIFITAWRSPCSPFVDEAMGKYIVAVMWVLVYLIFYYERIALGNYFNETSGHRGLFWYGLLTQAGAFTGASIIFTLNSLGKFNERALCEKYSCS